jgi:hypothetical protein
MDYLKHALNFWKYVLVPTSDRDNVTDVLPHRYHMLRDVEATLCFAFDALSTSERPQWWDSKLQTGIDKLGKHWKGSYAFVERDEVDFLRENKTNNEVIQDIFAGEENGFCEFQDMTLEMTEDGEEISWPRIFEEHLRSITPPTASGRAITRAQRRSGTANTIKKDLSKSFHFSGAGQDAAEQFFASGWLNPLPPQEKIPGWQRMTMMKYFDNEDGTIDTDALWAYEGVVLPGGKMIIGRWWSPMDGMEDMYSGPFIL